MIIDTQLVALTPEGEDAVLPCKATGYPEPTITWSLAGNFRTFLGLIRSYKVTPIRAYKYTEKLNKVNKECDIADSSFNLNYGNPHTPPLPRISDGTSIEGMKKHSLRGNTTLVIRQVFYRNRPNQINSQSELVI